MFSSSLNCLFWWVSLFQVNALLLPKKPYISGTSEGLTCVRHLFKHFINIFLFKLSQQAYLYLRNEKMSNLTGHLINKCWNQDSSLGGLTWEPALLAALLGWHQEVGCRGLRAMSPQSLTVAAVCWLHLRPRLANAELRWVPSGHQASNHCEFPWP